MSFQLQLDVDSATVGELAALLSAARAAGVRDDDALELDGTTLTIAVSAPADGRVPRRAERRCAAARRRLRARGRCGLPLARARRRHWGGHDSLAH